MKDGPDTGLKGHLRANLSLLVLTLLICCVLYPAVLWGLGQTFFKDQAEGSLVRDEQGNVIGSRLIAQPFTKDEYLWPRPSHAGSNGYDASASGASNWGASNPKLRDRVARLLGPLVVYRSADKKDQPVGPDIEDWLTPRRIESWAAENPDAAGWWIEADKANKKLVEDWQKDHPEAVAAWRKDNPDKTEPTAADLTVPFFTFYAQLKEDKPEVWKEDHGKLWPEAVRTQVQSVFFDSWRTANPKADLEPVPADMVMASGSGLDPHITLANARYQLKHRVAAARAKLLKNRLSKDRVAEEIETLLEKKASAPFGGAIGVPLVNVLEVNLELDSWMQEQEKSLP